MSEFVFVCAHGAGGHKDDRSMLALAKALPPLLKWLRPVEGALAADSLIQSPRRTSASVAALMLSLALVAGRSRDLG